MKVPGAKTALSGSVGEEKVGYSGETRMKVGLLHSNMFEETSPHLLGTQKIRINDASDLRPNLIVEQCFHVLRHGESSESSER